MRTRILISLILVCCIFIKANGQSPQGIPYQAVARDVSGSLITNQTISIRFTIHDIIPGGIAVYRETHSVSTNALGLFVVEVGGGTPVVGSMALVNWGGGSKFLEVELDPSGGTSFTSMGTTQMMSVPYALYAQTAANFVEIDPQVNSTVSNAVPKWNGSTLVDGIITDDGSKVGVGTTIPSAKLDVRENNNGAVIRVQNNSSSGYSAIDFQDNAGGGKLGIGYANSFTAWNSGNNYIDSKNAPLLFMNNSNESMRLDVSGNVGIGTSSPSSKLDVTGKTKTTNFQMTNGAASNTVLAGDGSGNASWVPSTSLAISETDPQVSSSANNSVPKWNGTTLTDGIITDDGTLVKVGVPIFNSDGKLQSWNTSHNGYAFEAVGYNTSWSGPAAQFWTQGTGPTMNIDWAGSGTNKLVTFKNFGNEVGFIGTNGGAYFGNDVGIGTATPSSRLHVNGSTYLNGFTGINTAPDASVPLSLKANGADWMLFKDQNGITQWDISNNSGNNFIISENNVDARFMIQGGGRVGIGTLSPSAKLSVSSSAVSGPFSNLELIHLLAPNMNNAQAVSFQMGKSATGNNQFEMRYNHVGNGSLNNYTSLGMYGTPSTLNISGYGNVGIGTTAPDDKLHVVSNGNSGVVIGGGNITGSEVKFLQLGNTHFSIYNNAGKLNFAETSTLSQTNTPGADLMTLSNAGFLGIGNNNPSERLDVNGKTKTTNFQMTSGAPASGKVLTAIDGAGNATWQAPAVSTETDPQVSSSTSNKIPKWNGTTLTDGIITDNGTDIGIGTTSPGQKLDVQGGIRLGNTSTPNTGAIRFTGSDFQGYDGAAWRSFITPPTAPPTGNYWSLNSSSVYYSGGSVGIGTNSPSANLEVTGSARAAAMGIGTTPAHPLHVAFPSGGFGSAGLDQQQVSGALNTVMDRNEFWQSFTAGQSGNLTKIEYRAQLLNGFLWTNGASGGNNGTYRLYAGNGTSGTVLATIPASAAVLNAIGNGWHYINLPNIPIIAGQQYTFRLSGVNDPNANCPHCGHATMYFGVNGSDVYSGGQFSAGGFSSSNDLMFKTWVAQQGTTPSLVATTSGNIGIRNNNPSTELDVSGTTRTTNFRMTNGASNGFVLQSDGSGNGSWVDPDQFPDKNWINSGTNIYSNAWQVGLNGVSSPQEALHLSGSIRLDGTSSAASSNGIIFKNSPQVSIKMDGPYLKFRNQSNNPSFQLDPFGSSEFFGNMSVTGKGTFGNPSSGSADGQFRIFSPQNAPNENAFYVSVDNTANAFVMKDDGRVIVSSNPTATDQLDPNAYAMWVKGNKQGIAVQVSDAVTNGDNNFMSFIDGNNNIRGRIEGFSLANGDFLPPTLTTPVPTIAELNAFSCYLVETFGWTFDTDPLSVATLVATVALQTACMDGGITYGSGSGDYAEYLEKENPDEVFNFGDVVGVRGGKISKNTEGAEQVMSVSLAPIVLGKVPPHDSLLYKFEKIGFMGQVPVKVKGKVKSGDYILASGNHDGYAVAVSPEDLELSHLGSVLGRSWMSMDLEQPKFVNVVIGVNSNEMTQIAKKFDERIKNLESELSSMKDLQTSQTEIMKQLNVLKAEINMKNTSMKE